MTRIAHQICQFKHQRISEWRKRLQADDYQGEHWLNNIIARQSPPALSGPRRAARIPLLGGRRPGRWLRPIAPELLIEVRRQPAELAELGEDRAQQLDPR